MGVPKFYKWLSERYPLINQVASSDIRPEFDNMYLDMNGIIHNCTHSDSADESVRTKALSEAQMLTNVFKYIEKLFSIAQPKKLLYMAIDGVAPRAKMNQQRQRRFRSAKDARESMEEARRRGEDVDPNAAFDSNCITPGTEFMVSLSKHIRYFIRKKMKEDAAWQKVKVIFSGAEVPGEGEHKIMLYIRNMKSQPGYEPNQRHLLYGLDADLVMLSLASHEPHFSLLREEVVFGNASLPRKILKKQDEFQFLHISLLREYIDLEFRTAVMPPVASTPLPFAFDLERVIDDWVILAFFVGNDFLPHLPTLDIGEGGLDTLFQIYKEELPLMDGYIFENRTIHWPRLERICHRMGQLEEEIFAERQNQAIEYARKQRRQERKKAVIEIHEDELFEGEPSATPSPDPSVIEGTLEEIEEEEKHQTVTKPIIFDSQLKMLMKKDAGKLLDDNGNEVDYESLPFKSRYYREKFPEFFDTGVTLLRQHSGTDSKGSTSQDNIRALVKNYTQGLAWVASYYYEGCRSWKWFFEYRYAPLASDMVNLSDLDLTFQLGCPFRPMEQLLGVLPPASGRFLPPAYRALMDPRTSPVADFYPLDFSIDMNGKRSAWEGIALIPFIDEVRLLKALSNISQSQLTETERKRNERYGNEYMIEYDTSVKETVPSTCSAFASIVECHSRESIWHVPAITMTPAEKLAYETETRAQVAADPTLVPVPSYYAGNFQPKLCDGVVMPMKGYPALQANVDHNGATVQAALQKIAVNVFGMESKKDSLVLKVARSTPYPTGPSLAKHYLGQRVYVDWPYMKEAQVVGLTDQTHVWSTSGGRQMTQGEQATHRTECAIVQQKLIQGKAVDIGAVQVLLKVQTFIGMRRAPTGAIKRAFSEETTFVPLQLAFLNLSNPDPRYAELPPPSLADAFPLNSRVLYTGPQHYGAIGTILSHDRNNTVTVKLTVQPPETDFGRTIASKSQLQYYPSYLVSKSLSIHPLVLSKICSSVFVQQERCDIGLKIKFAKQSMQVPEYARRVDAWNAAGDKEKSKNNNEVAQQGNNEGWEYSEKAVALLAAYKRRFPLLFEMMNAEPNTYKYDGSRLIQPTPTEAKSGDLSNPVPEKTASDAIKEIETWLKTVGINDLLLIPCNSQLMAERGIKAVEAESSRLAALRDAAPAQEITLSDVPIFHLYRPDPVVPWSPTEVELPSLGDRVICIRSDSGAPLGARGTVVCVHMSRHVEVVFDKEFMSGTHLHHKCSNLRGQTLPVTSIINLTKPKVLAPVKNYTSAQSVPKKTAAPAPAPAAAAPAAAKPAAASAPVSAPVAASAAASSSSNDVDAVSNQLKQMLGVGAPAPAAATSSSSSVAASAAAPSDATSSEPVDPMQRLMDKGKARKKQPLASGVGTGILVGPPVQPHPMMYPPGPYMQPMHPMPPMQHGMYPPPPMPMQPPPHMMQQPFQSQPPVQQQQQQPQQQTPANNQQAPPKKQQKQKQPKQ